MTEPLAVRKSLGDSLTPWILTHPRHQLAPTSSAHKSHNHVQITLGFQMTPSPMNITMVVSIIISNGQQPLHALSGWNTSSMFSRRGGIYINVVV